MKKTFFMGALFLLLIAPSVSHASGISDWFSELFGMTPAETQTATALPATSDWLDLKVNDSDGSVSAPDGTSVQLRWVVRNVIDVSNCHVGYPGESGHVSNAVAVFGSKSVTLYPSRSSVSYIELVCTRGTEQGRDVVAITSNAPSSQTNTTHGGTIGTGAGNSAGSSGTGVGGIGTGNTFNVSHTGAQVSGSGSGASGAGGGVGSAGSGSTGSSGNSGGSGSGHSGNIGSVVGGAIHAANGYINTAQKGADRTMTQVTNVVNGILGTIGRAIGIGGGNNGGTGKGGDFGGTGKGGSFGGGGKGGDFGGAGGGKGGIGGGGSGGKPAIPDDDNKPAKPKGK